jgi:hypothetical protein
MDEARRVIARLERIERLRGDGAPAAILLGEVRALLADGERWLATERPEGLEDARVALERCRHGLSTSPGEEVVAETAL